MDWFQWVGFAISLLTTMCCGSAVSFNVYAVKLKETFRLNQWQIELLGSSAVMGWSFLIVFSWVIKRFGYSACYTLTLLLTTGSSLLMWLSTQYVEFFRERAWLMCVFLFLTTSGAGGGIQCVSSIGVEKFPAKHTGKVVGIYMAVSAFGRIYNSFLFEFFFQKQRTLGPFFVTIAVSFTCAYLLCYIFHKRQEDDTSVDGSEEDNLINDDIISKNFKDDDLGSKDKKTTKSELHTLLTSPYFYFMSLCFVIFQSSTLTFRNNITSIAVAVGSTNEIHFVYILSVVLIASRVIFGVIYDYFSSLQIGLFLLLVQYLFFCVAMLIGLLWLDGVTIYLLVVLASVGCGGGHSLPVSMMTSEFGTASYPLITGLLDLGLAPVVLGAHLSVALIYENTEHLLGTKDLFCKACFRGTFIILLGLVTLVAILQILNFVIRFTKSRLACCNKA